jgi:hypothetical protein
LSAIHYSIFDAAAGAGHLLARRRQWHPFDALPDERLPKVAAEMALSVLAYNLTRVINILGTGPLIAAIRA